MSDTISQAVKDAERGPDKPELELSGVDGNAFMLLGVARKVAVRNDMDWDKIQAEATSGDYDHLLQTLMKYFDVV